MNQFTFLKKWQQKRPLFRLFSMLCFITTMFASSPAYSQIPITNSFTPANCGNVNCTANDVRVISAYLSGPDGAPINCSSAQPFLNAQLHLIVFSNTQRKGVSISGNFDVKINGVTSTVLFANCFTNITLNDGGNNDLAFSFPLPDATCVDVFSLNNLFVSWGTGKTDFCDGSSNGHCPETPSKCRYTPDETIPVTVKLEVDFISLQGDCSAGGDSKAFDFTPSIVTDKNIQYPVTFTWNFGDNTPIQTTTASSLATVAAAKISHTYAAEGLYTITLVGSDASPDPNTVFSVTSTHTVLAVSCCTLVAPISGGDLTGCEGETITATATGGPGETINWFDADGNGVAVPSLSSVGSVTYYAEASTSTCVSPTRTPVKLTITAKTVTTFNAIDPICSGGTITLPTSSKEGIPGTWSPAVDNTATTEYTFTPADGQCATTAKLTVTVNAKTTPTFDAVGPVCSGGTITLPATSKEGIPGTWSPAVDNTTTKEYTFTPADGQCATTAKLTVTVNAKTTPTFDAIGPICSGGTITLPATSKEGIPGTWSPVVDNTTTKEYTFTPADGQCATTATLTVVVNPLPPCSITGPAAVTLGANASFSGPVGSYSYQWAITSNTSGASFVNGSTGSPVVVTTATVGSYILSLTVTNTSTNCVAQSCSKTITVGPGNPVYTVTQGFYGNVGGKICIGGTTYIAGTNKANVPSLIAASLVRMGGSLKLGIVANSRTFTINNTSAEISNLITYMPAGQTAAIITSNSTPLTNNNTNILSPGASQNLPKIYNKKISSVLLGQTITLALNINSSVNNPLGSLVLKPNKYLTTQLMDPNTCSAPKPLACTPTNNAISSLQLTATSAMATWMSSGKTVNDLLALASNMLGGGTNASMPALIPANVTLTDVNNAIDVINRSFDGGRFYLGYYDNAKSCGSSLARSASVITAAEERQAVTALTATAYPNPFTDRVKFSIVSPVSGKATLDVYNMMGQKVKTVFAGYLFANRTQVVDYNIPSSNKGALIYTLRVGDKQVNGKIVQIK
ncbi:PKD domain-containing protein [Ferruginibacter paludis]|uniref:PKD domain-containing protein n=1 Tax=Ferruginibacter paludis TaxID=1310417 RepID=UPI0025B2891B|nr:PKD domain-containing protein [Ferruginibacter paludis]MDN3654621.1 PKD domain-containing protein [Ferruginibacter paludis]